MDMKTETKSFFWQSYVDLLTALFIVMLVLFILSYKSFNDEKQKYEIKARQYEKIQQIEESIKNLQGRNFIYQEDFKRHILSRQVHFGVGEAIIDSMYYDYLIEAGNELMTLIRKLSANSVSNIRYLIIIEGMASKDDFEYNYELSYSRAKALYDFWRSKNILFNPEFCEVLIAGSGTGGIGRESIETLNQRFIIQIIPKIGE